MLAMSQGPRPTDPLMNPDRDRDEHQPQAGDVYRHMNSMMEYKLTNQGPDDSGRWVVTYTNIFGKNLYDVLDPNLPAFEYVKPKPEFPKEITPRYVALFTYDGQVVANIADEPKNIHGLIAYIDLYDSELPWIGPEYDEMEWK